MEHSDIVSGKLDELVSPAMLPDEINKRAGAIELYRVAVLALAGIGAVGLIGILAISAMGRTVPDGAIVLASVAVGALAGMVGGQAVR
jgi:hypothetical protein